MLEFVLIMLTPHLYAYQIPLILFRLYYRNEYDILNFNNIDIWHDDTNMNIEMDLSMAHFYFPNFVGQLCRKEWSKPYG